MTDLENRLSSENILGKVNRKNILDFFNDKKFELNSHGMDVVTHNLNIPKWNEYDKLSILFSINNASHTILLSFFKPT